MARRRSWTDEQLREAVATSETLVEVLAKLGLSRGGGTLEAVRKRLVALGLNSPHERWRQRSQAWDADPSALYSAEPQGRPSWSDQDLAWAVAASRSIAGVLRELNLAVGGWTYVIIKGARDTAARPVTSRSGGVTPSRCNSTTSMVTVRTTGSSTCVCCARTVMRRPIRGAARTSDVEDRKVQ